MDDFIEKVKNLTTEYLGYEAKGLVIQLAVEQFRAIRNYPGTWDEDKILADMEKNIAKIAMAVVELDAKEGVENQLSHSENGFSRTYSQSIMAYSDVIGFATVV
jgi:hypothetical protein